MGSGKEKPLYGYKVITEGTDKGWTYRVMDLKSNKFVIQGIVAGANQDIAEFIAVYEMIRTRNNSIKPIYTTSESAQIWTYGAYCNSKIIDSDNKDYLHNIIYRILAWLKQNRFNYNVLRWRNEWGK